MITPQDGHGPSLKSVVDNDQMKREESMKVSANKHASSSSTIAQSADIGRQFAITKSENKTTTSVNIPRGFGLKGIIEEEFNTLAAKGVLILKLPARKAILDHIVSCPEIFGKSMSPKTTKKGFVKNGMIDEITHLYPDIHMMLKTCKQEVKQEQVDKVYTNFPELYSIMQAEGHIREEVYNRMGFNKDTNYQNDVVIKPDNISNEMRHRAKILSSNAHRRLRAQKQEDKVMKVKQKRLKELVLEHKTKNCYSPDNESKRVGLSINQSRVGLNSNQLSNRIN